MKEKKSGMTEERTQASHERGGVAAEYCENQQKNEKRGDGGVLGNQMSRGEANEPHRHADIT